MNKNELIDEIADECELTKAKAAEVIDALTCIIAESLASGDEVRLVGFGTFSVSHRKASEGRNPRTGAVIKIAASNKAKFKAGKALTESVNKTAKRKAA